MDLHDIKPRFRGLIHLVSFFVSLTLAPLLLAIASAPVRAAVAVYSISLSALFGTSALYHRIDWTPQVRAWLRKLDHSMIFFLIAGTFTPLAIALSNISWMSSLLYVVWGGALLGMVAQLVPVSIPKPIVVIPYLALGWIGITILPATWMEEGPVAPVLLIVGGLLYSVGAAVYARRSPNPKPGVFGYHEVFHAFVSGAAVLHYLAIAILVAG